MKRDRKFKIDATEIEDQELNKLLKRLLDE